MMGTWGIVSLVIGALIIIVGSFVLLTRGTWKTNRDITQLRPPKNQWLDDRVGSKQWLEHYTRVPPGFVLVDRAKLTHILRNSRYPMDGAACAIDDATAMLKDLEARDGQDPTHGKPDPEMIQISIDDAETLTEWFNDFCPPLRIFQACERVRTAIVAAYPEKMKEAHDAR